MYLAGTFVGTQVIRFVCIQPWIETPESMLYITTLDMQKLDIFVTEGLVLLSTSQVHNTAAKLLLTDTSSTLSPPAK